MCIRDRSVSCAERAMHEERNHEICDCYINGMTLKDCGKKFKLSPERIRQILRQEGVFKHARARPQTYGLKQGLVEDSSRDEFLGINISEADKDALRAEAKRRGLSMSRLSSDFIKEMLD